MVNYQCQRCGYYTINKSYLKRHLLRKNLCQPKINQIDRYDLLISYGFYQESNMFQKYTKNTPNIHQNTPKINYKCKFCEKIFSRSDALKRHIDSRCKEKKIYLVKLKY